MDYICRRCGNEVKNKTDYELFEQMHWLCFHFEYEHGDYDVDEPCDDPSCPWNRISGNDVDILGRQMDLSLKSESLDLVLYINQLEIQKEYLPSRECKILYRDEDVKLETSVWFEDGALMNFVNELEMLERDLVGSAELQSMSPDEFQIAFRRLNSRGYFLVTLMMQKKIIRRDFTTEKKYKTEFDVLGNEVEKFKSKIMHLLNM